MKQLGPNDKRVSALSAVSAGLLTHEIPVNESGTTKKLTVSQIITLSDSLNSIYGASTSSPGAGFASDTYLVGSRCLIPTATGQGSLLAGSMYRCKFSVSKTAAGTVAPIITVRFGTAGSTADTSIGSLTFPAQTAAIDSGLFEIFCTWRTVGTGTTATLIPVGTLAHNLAITGLSIGPGGTPVVIGAVGAGHNSQLSSAGVGVSVNGGTSAAWTIALVQAELFNLA